MNGRGALRGIGLTSTILLSVWTADVRAQSEYRGLWVDAFGEGYRTSSQVDNLVSRAVAGRYNAIFAEVLAYQDAPAGSTSHGAFWNSNIVPKVPGVGSFDPLGYLVQRAHNYNLHVFAWIVPFRVSTTWPPAGNATLAAHPEWLMVPQANMGGGPAIVSDSYTLDPGSAEVQEYLLSIVRELVTNYAIDGIQWDYIRYVQSDAGYPAYTWYAKSGLERFRTLTGYVGTPPPTGYTPWDDYRRRTITEIVRRARAEIQSITSNPRQPVRNTAALITLGNAPSSFSSSSAWARFQNWEEWMRLGFLDVGVPMNYDRDWEPTEYTWFRNWVTQELTWRYSRHMVVGTALYLNSFANSKDQMLYARGAGANGLASYDYTTTCNSGCNYWDWYPYVAANVFTSTAAVPTMPWRDPATATEGTLWGRVTDGSGQPLDDATVGLARTSLNARTDANGYYVVTLVPAGASGTAYSATAQKTGVGTQTKSITVTRAGLTRQDFVLGGAAPTITQHPSAASVCAGGTVQFTVAATGDAPLSYQWQKNNVNLTAGGHYSGVTTTTLTVSSVDTDDVADYRCVVTNANGTAASNQAALTLKAPTAITENPVAQSICLGGTAQFAVAATGSGAISYQWQKNGANLAEGGHYSGVMTAILTISDAGEAEAADYQCLVTADCGSVTSQAASLTVYGPSGIVSQPESQIVYIGSPATFAVAVAGETPAYQWQKDGANVSDGGPYSGATSETLLIAAADAGTAGQYRCLVNGVCIDAVSEEATLAVTVQADLDKDGDVDGADYGVFGGCFNGTGNAFAAGCESADLNGDGSVDGADFGLFSTCFNGSGNPPGC